MPPANRQGGPPRRLSSFIGRDTESAQVWVLLGSYRLVTITGPGGAGKSRLAMHIADSTADEVWWVELSDLDHMELLPPRIAQVSGVHLLPGADIRAQLGAQFCSRPALLVLDNCEHLASDVGELAHDLLCRGAGLRILATSRRPLGIEGESAWSIPPLELPPKDTHGVTHGELASAASARLFLERARAARPGFVLDEEATGQLVRLCHHLDGMPLALELAAARVRSLDIGRIRQELENASDLLSRTAPTRASRHRSMRASIAWSEGLLTQDERVVLRRLAVFAGDFALEDALPVVSQTGPTLTRIIEAIDGLVTQSLLMFDDSQAGPPRYRLLEVIRQHAARRLLQAGEEEDLHRRHAEHFASRASELGSQLAQAWDDQAFASLAADIRNLEQAVRFLCEHSEPELAVRLLWDSQSMWGLAAPAIAAGLMEHLMRHQATLDPRSLARLHVAAAVIRADAGAFSASLESASRALPLAHEARDPITVARAHLYCEAIRSSATPVSAEVELLSALERCADAGDLAGTIFGRFWLGASVVVFQGATSRGLELLAEYLKDEAAMRHPVHAAGIHAMIAKALLERGVIPRALEHARSTEEQIDRVAGLLRSGATRFRAMSIPGSVAALVRGYAAVLQDQPPLPDVDLLASSARSATDGHGLAAYIYRFVSGLGHLMRGEPKSALADLRAAVPLSVAIGGWFNTSTCTMGALAALADEDLPGADEWLAQVDVATVISPLLRARYRVAQADLALARGDTDIAEHFAHVELESVAAETIAWEAAQLLEVICRVAVAKGSHRRAVLLAAAATRLRMGTGLALGPPGHLIPFQRDLDLARSILDDAQFEDAWHQGSGLSLHEAVAYAHRTRGRRGRPSFGWRSLTPTEHRVVDLVTEGLTNPQIAAQLLVSQETIKTHMRHIFAKLGVRNRAQVAAAAASEASRMDPDSRQ